MIAFLLAEAALWKQIVFWVVVAGFFIGLPVFLVWARRENLKQQKYHRDNVDRHRLHADRTEEHMARVETLLERIASALEKRNNE